LMTTLPTFAQKVVFQDDFLDNTNEWDFLNESTSRSNIFNGNYILSVTDEQQAAFVVNEIAFDAKNDHEITVRCRQFEGNKEAASGIVWNYQDDNNYSTFLVTGESSYQIMRVQNGKEELVKAWTKHPDLHPQGRSNILTIKVTALTTFFYANEKLLYSSFSYQSQDPLIGFWVDGNASLAVDILTVKQLGGEIKTAFEEEFDDNRHKWKSIKTEGEQVGIVDGKYFMRRSFPTDYSIYTNSLSLDYQKDFEIESHLRQLEGSPKADFGLVWAAADAQNFNAFVVNSEGKYSIYQVKNKYQTPIKTGNLPLSAALNTNISFKIKKNSSNYSFYINDNLLFSTDWKENFGAGLGFVLTQNAGVAAENLFIKQDATIEAVQQNPPIITFLNPKNDAIVSKSDFDFKVGVQSEGNIQKVELYVNNRLMNEPQSFGKDQHYKALVQQKIFLAEGSNHIKVVAQNQGGESLTKSISIRYDRNADALKPTLTWLNPSEESIQVDQKEFDLKAGIISPSKITGVTVLLNKNHENTRGFEVEEAQKQEQESYAVVLERAIELKVGTNELTIRIETENGMSLEETRQIIVAPDSKALEENNSDLPTGRKDYALLFATDDYDEWSDLVNPINDAQTIGNELKQFYGFEVELIKNPTTEQVLSKLKEYARKKYSDQDQLFIFVAGHGKFDEDFGEGYLVCKNSLKNDDGNASYITHSSLRTITNNIPTKHIFLSMDVCFGGTFDPKIAGHRGENDFELAQKADFVKRKLQFRTRKYLTSGGKEYVPDGKPGQHSPFARKFLEALRNYGGKDKIMTTAELLSFLKDTKPEPRFGEFGTNDPGSDFLFIAK